MEEQKPTYNPTKNYKWDQNTEFVMNGPEFGAILNGLRTLLNTPETKRVLMALEASRTIDVVLARAVEAGQAVEDERPKMQKA